MDDDFVDVFPSAGGVGDSPVKANSSSALEPDGTTHINNANHRRPASLSIPASLGMETGGAAAAVSPALPRFGGIAMPSPSPAASVKESALRSARPVSDVLELENQENFGGLSDTNGAIGMEEEEEEEEPMQLSPEPSPSPSPRGKPPMRFGMAPALTIDPGGECVPTELEKKRAKLEKYRLVCSEVGDSFIYVAGEDAAKQEGLVRNVGVTHIINCAGPQCDNYLEYTGRFEFLRLNFYDHRTEDVAWFIYSAFDFIAAAKAKKGRVLIHCVQGVSRSCTLAIAWLMLTTTMDYEEAYRQVREGRPICAPNTGFICSLLEWAKRRKQPPAAPLMYRTAWHLPNFPQDVVLKLCLHEDDRTHVRPSLDALDSRGCYLIVVPRRPSVNGHNPESTPVPRSQSESVAVAAAAADKPETGGRRCVSPSDMDDGDEDDLVDSTATISGTRANGCLSPAPAAASPTKPEVAPDRPESEFGTRASESGTPTAPASDATAPEPGTTGQESGTTAPESGNMEFTWNPTSRAPTLSLPVVAPGAQAPAPKAPPAVPTPALCTAPAPGSAAAVAAGEAARTAKALEVGVAIAAAFRGSASSLKSAAKAAVGVGSGSGQPAGRDRGAASEGSLGPAARAVAAASAGVEVYLWRGSESKPQMLEVVREGARWLRDYEGWGAGARTVIVEEGQEPPELLQHLERTGGDEREPPIYGDLTAPSPPATCARTGSGSLFQHQEHSICTPRHAALPSPAEPPMLSPAGPSPSPGGGVGFSPSPYGIGVSPAGGGVGSLCGVSPAGGGDMCGVSPAGGGGLCSGDLLLATISPTGSTAPSPATSRLYLSGDGSAGISYAGLGGSASHRCSMTSATEGECGDDSYLLSTVGSRAALDQSSDSALDGVNGRMEVGGLHEDALPLSQQQQQQLNESPAPRLFELADDMGGLQWSELAIFDDQDLLPQCCFLLVPPRGRIFLWIGEAFAAAHTEEGADGLRQVRSLARDAAVCVANMGILGTIDVNTAVLISGDGNEPEEWWDAFESGYT